MYKKPFDGGRRGSEDNPCVSDGSELVPIRVDYGNVALWRNSASRWFFIPMDVIIYDDSTRLGAGVMHLPGRVANSVVISVMDYT